MTDKISNEDIRQLSEALNDAQESWEETAYLANPKMPCPECGGSGSVGGGIFDSTCVRCMGERVLDVPGSTPPEGMPDFKKLRASISAYGDALALASHPNAELRRQLPAATTLPTLDQLRELKQRAISTARQLTAGGIAPGAYDPKLLKAPKKKKGMEGDGDLGEYSDAELAEFEDQDKEHGR